MGTKRQTLLGKRDLLPEELSALVLRSLKADAEKLLGEPVTDAVITVPAYFNDKQRKATRRAGQLAGLKVERLLNEPTAAALAYGIHQKGADARFLVFDLGGGTFDVSVLELFEGVIEVRASTGDNHLGGEDFNEVLIDRMFASIPVGLEASGQERRREALPAGARPGGAMPAQADRRNRDRDHERHLARTSPFELMTRDRRNSRTPCAPLIERLRTPVLRALRDSRFTGRQPRGNRAGGRRDAHADRPRGR